MTDQQRSHHTVKLYTCNNEYTLDNRASAINSNSHKEIIDIGVLDLFGQDLSSKIDSFIQLCVTVTYIEKVRVLEFSSYDCDHSAIWNAHSRL